MAKILRDIQQYITEAYENYMNRDSDGKLPIKYFPGEICHRRNVKMPARGKDSGPTQLDKIYVKCRILRKAGSTAYDVESLDGKPLGKAHVDELLKIDKGVQRDD